MSSEFKSRLKAGELLCGSMVTLATPAVAEILSESGFDWLFVDAEHGALETSDVQGILQAVGRTTPCLVRVPETTETHIKRVMDLGAAGVIAPMVNTARHAEQVVRFAKYAPLGNRGVGLARAHGYGLRFNEYMQAANDETVVVVQAEHIDAVNNIESIVKVPGIDAVFVGPYDLSASLGKMGQIDDPEVTDAIERVTAVCQAAGMPLGFFGVSASAVQPYIERGYNLVVAGVDTLMLGTGAAKLLEKLHTNRAD